MSKGGFGCVGKRKFDVQGCMWLRKKDVSGEESRLKYPLVPALVLFIAVPASFMRSMSRMSVVVKGEGCFMSKDGCGCIRKKDFW